MIKYLLPFLLLAGQANAAITADIEASRITGVAPLAVFFDATATTSTNTTKPFDELLYKWDFDDAGAGDWLYGNANNNSKETDSGTVAAHVFETAGTYTVELTVSGDGTSTDSVVITVTDPDTYYSGTNTICVSTSATYTDCPSGAATSQSSDFDSALLNFGGAGKRILFRRGETFVANASTNINNTGAATIGAFGAGTARAIVSISGAPEQILNFSSGNGDHAQDQRVLDLDFVGNSNDTEPIHAGNTTSDILIMGNKGYESTRFVNISPAVIHYWSSDIHYNLFIVENDFGRSGSHGLYVGAEKLAIVGNKLYESPNSHIVRVVYANPFVMSHNYVYGDTASSTHTIKYHNGDDSPNAIKTYEVSGQFVIADNLVEGSNQGSWVAAIAPQSGAHAEVIELGIIERNDFVASAQNTILVYISAQDITVRNNRFALSAGNTTYATLVIKRGVEPAPDNVQTYNNAFLVNGTGISVDAGAAYSTSATSGVARNNVLFSTDGGGVAVGGTGTFSDNNTTAQTGSYLPSAAEIDAGYAVAVLDDYAGCDRPYNTDWDIGASEYTLVCTPVGEEGFPPFPSDLDLHADVDNGRTYQFHTGAGWGRQY